MSTIFEQFLLLPVTAPGSMAYHAILAFTIFGALQGALNNRRSNDPTIGLRMTIGLVSLLILQFLQFTTTGLAWQGLISAGSLVPVMDRAIGLLNLVIIIWLWTYPKTNHLADAVVILVGLVLVSLAAFTLVWWQKQTLEEAGLYFNGSAADVLGGGVAMALVLLGVFSLVIRRPGGWGYGLAMFLGLSIGYLLHWFMPTPDQDLAGAVRLAEMAVFPLLLALPQRTSAIILQPPPVTVPAAPEQRTFAKDPKAQQELLKLSLISSPKQFYQDLARVLSQLMTADLCLLALPQVNADYLIFPEGYNLISDRRVEGFSLEQRKVPALVNALRNNTLLHLPVGSTSPDIRYLADSLQVNRAGGLLAAPIAEKNQSPLLSIIMLTPFSNRSWSEEDQQYLADAALALVPVIQRVQHTSQAQDQLEQSRNRMETLDSDTAQATSDNEQLLARLEVLQQELASEKQRSVSLAALVEEHSVLREEVAAAELPDQKAEGWSSHNVFQENDQMENDLRLVLEELANLRQSLAQADQKIIELQAQEIKNPTSPDQNEQEVIISIAQELRQPMSSIVGYTDLLLGESVGLLGAMQRKFLERVKASSERMGGLLEELIQVASLDSGRMSLKPVMVDLNTVIDDAVSSMIAQLSEKNIALRVDLPDELPPIHADLEAIQQVLSNLLQNAGMVTPDDGEISLRARVEIKENAPSYLLLQVTDQGGGIPAEELPRVFSRLYRADNVLIQGIGDTGVGLSIVKALVEAHHGRVWVDTEIGHGSAFSVLLPLTEMGVGTDLGDAVE